MANRVNWVTQSREKVLRKGAISLAGLGGTNVSVGVTRLEPGHQPFPHSHHNEEIVCMLSGTLDMHMGDAVERLGPGDILYIPADVVHYGVVVGNEAVRELDVWAPPRDPGK